ncbi:hypothetical protein DSM25559_5285 [Agrobacterium rosae]|uniref:Uncharacterized protein n=2 Tax=Agrobacterium rosae TaxID=1972867 RepID=A0A1R3U346_9HYPH|nr:hypothetical protein DSM25559_5285 [Agrobacterium rosae]
MKVHMQIANGYKPRIAKIMHDDPTINQLEATTRFIVSVYGAWIDQQFAPITPEYSFEAITKFDFVVSFTHDDDAAVFLQKVGGRVLEENDGA